MSGAVLLITSAAIITGLFLSFYAGSRQEAFAGADTAYYLWRAELVTGEGLEALRGSIPSPSSDRAWRVGHPLLVAFLHDLGGIRPAELVYVLPAIMGAVVGLAAGAFGLQGLLQPRWSFVVFAVAAGASINMTVTSVGHADNLVVNGLVMAAATTALLAADRRPGVWASIVLLSAAALTHWSFTALFVGILLALAVSLVPESLRFRRGGMPPLETPSARLALLSGGAVLAGAGALAMAPASPAPPAPSPNILPKLRWDGAAFASLGPLFLVGAVSTTFGSDRRRRRGALLALLWGGTAIVGVIGALLLLPVPAHRLLPFALAIPILAAAAVVWATRVLSMIRPAAVGRSTGVLLVVVALAAGLLVAQSGWREPPPTRAQRLADASAAARYLDAVPDERPVVFVLDPSGTGSPRKRMRVQFDLIRSVLPAHQIRRTHAYLGEAARLVQGEPTLRPGDQAYNETSLRYWSSIRPLLDDDPIVLALSSFLSWGQRRDLPGTRVTEELTVVRGPVPEDMPATLGGAGPPGNGRLVSIAAIALLVLTAVGLGWTKSLLRLPPLETLALAPALGASVLVLVGAAASHVGVGDADSRVWMGALVAAGGWLPFVIRQIRRRRTDDGGSPRDR